MKFDKERTILVKDNFVTLVTYYLIIIYIEKEKISEFNSMKKYKICIDLMNK